MNAVGCAVIGAVAAAACAAISRAAAAPAIITTATAAIDAVQTRAVSTGQAAFWFTAFAAMIRTAILPAAANGNDDVFACA